MADNSRATETKGTIRLGLLGLGTVGGGVYKTIASNREVIRQRTGYETEVARILVRDLEKERQFDVDAALLTLQVEDVLEDDSIDIFIEVMGGLEPAKSIITQALRSGRHVITANKELLAKHGAELLAVAEEHGAHLLFEASVAGGIPIVRMLQGYLTANRVNGLSGILNGTSNYILTEMAKSGRAYDAILAEAQALGYAEADPTSDVEGFDAAYKLAILTNLAYDVQVKTDAIRRQGISALHPADLRAADEWGFAVKLIGSSALEADGVQLSVRPRLLPDDHPLARVDDVFNAVTVRADVVGDLTFIGRGAGELPTASAVVEDLTALLAGQEAIRRPRWNRVLEGAASDANEALEDEGGVFLACECPEEESAALEAGLKEALEAIGCFAARCRAEAVEEGRIRHAWLLGGAGEELIASCLRDVVQTANFGWKSLLLPVEGVVEPGVEWSTTGTSSYEESRLLDSQAL